MARRRTFWQRAASRLARDWSLPLMFEPPVKIQIVPTNACNLRCRACPKTWYDTDNRPMAPEVYARVREQALPVALEAHLQGLGEPTLSPLFDEMVRDAIRLDLPFHFVTNAARLTDERIRLLAESKAFVTVSLDGATADSHEWSRTEKSDFAHVLRTLETLNEARRQARGGALTIQISTVVTRRNVAEIPDIIRLAKRVGASAISLITPGMGPRDDEFAREAIGRHEETYRAHWPAIRQAAQEAGIALIAPPYLEAPAPTPAPEQGEAPRDAAPAEARRRTRRIFPRKCFAPFREMYIDVDGWVRPCCVATGIGMGNLLERDLMTIWNNRHYRRLRRAINSNNPPGFCRGCSAADGITGGDEAFLEKHYARGHPPLPDPPKIGFLWVKDEGKLIEF
ncbi:MAG: radical SAM protein [Candidatus Sumerlaeota bacterium]|nr:radical SAM protein [Candidatus Sumerlaeota bacterium]